MGSLSSMGILNALQTGDPKVDMVLAMCFPLVLRSMLDATQSAWKFVQDWWLGGGYSAVPGRHERRIVYNQSNGNPYNHNHNHNNNSREDTQNTVLIKAIDMYLHSQVRLNLTRSNVDLTSTKDNQSSVSRNALQHCCQRYRHRHHDGMDNKDEDKTLAGALAKYQMVH
ncbi:hypothetical protein ACA910_021019 [Epithemia clementina (nom. ined.)]